MTSTTSTKVLLSLAAALCVLVAGTVVTASCATPPASLASCADEAKNGVESDVDCGGGACAPCAEGRACNSGVDCANQACESGVCQPARCDDGVKNGDETAADCGGGCARCADGASCRADGDCASGRCLEGVCRSPMCTDGVKNGDETDMDCGGACPPCAPGSACSGAGDCSTRSCKGGVCEAPVLAGLPCIAGAQCQTGRCVDGVCCDSACEGACDACDLLDAMGRCTPRAAGAAGSPACAPYTCSGRSADCGTACPSSAPDAGDSPDGGSYSACDPAYYCGAGACIPKQASGVACADGGQCQTGFCAQQVCCDAACAAPCEACNLSGREGLCTLAATGTPGAPACVPYMCSGSAPSCPTSCVASADCDAASFCDRGQCAPRKVNGQACAAQRDCVTGYCVDAVCCDAACQQACAACDLPGSEGTCGPVPSGSVGAPACAPYVCSGTAPLCPAACASITDCDSLSYCAGGACVPRKPNGQTCSASAECASGDCVDGFCCNTTCGGACDACNVAGSEGTCTLLPSSTACRASAGPCDVAESCSGVSSQCPADALVTAGSQCRASAGVCDMAETCSGATAQCPADALVAAGTQCRASAGVCDVAESCSGAATACPADALLPRNTSCGTRQICSPSGSCVTDLLTGFVNCGTPGRVQTGNQLCQASGFASASVANGYNWFQCGAPGDCPGGWQGDGTQCSAPSWCAGADCVGFGYCTGVVNIRLGTGATSFGAEDYGPYNCVNGNPGWRVRLICQY